jgi:hypothetical protein
VSKSRPTQAVQVMQANQVQQNQRTTTTSMDDASQKDSDNDQPLERLNDKKNRPYTLLTSIKRRVTNPALNNVHLVTCQSPITES